MISTLHTHHWMCQIYRVLHAFSIFQQKPPQAPQPPSPLGFTSSSGCQFLVMPLDSCWTIPHMFPSLSPEIMPGCRSKRKRTETGSEAAKSGVRGLSDFVSLDESGFVSRGGCKAKSEKIDEQFITILCGSLLFYLLVGCYISCCIPIISAWLVVKYSRIFVFPWSKIPVSMMKSNLGEKNTLCPLASDISWYIYHLSISLSINRRPFPLHFPMVFPARLEHGLKAVMARKLAKLDAQLQRASASVDFQRMRRFWTHSDLTKSGI